MNYEKFVLDMLEGVGAIDFDAVIRGLGVAYIIFWVIVLGWVWTDSGERTSNIFIRIFSVLIVAALNIVGLVIYLFVRPKRSVEEIYWADLERRYLKFETSELGDCPKCGFQLEPGFVNCPECSHVLKVKCTDCEVLIDKDWKSCAYCGTKNTEYKKGVEDEVDREEMDEKIRATKEEASETVEAKKTRYAFRGGFAVKVVGAVNKRAEAIGNWLVGLMSKSKSKIKVKRTKATKKAKKNGKSKSKKGKKK